MAEAGMAAEAGASGDAKGGSDALEIARRLSIPFEPAKRSFEADAPLERFYDWTEVYPFLRHILPFRKAVMREILRAATPEAWTEWPETTLYKSEDAEGDPSDWRVIPLVYTFPANDPTQTVWVEQECRRLPLVSALLHAIPGVRTALVSKLGPGTVLAPHRGWASLANHVLRCHWSLKAPGNTAVVVEDTAQHHTEGGIIVFDDSKEHYAFNEHPTEERIVLIFDLPRPAGLGEGEAEGAETPELLAFIERFAAGRY
jgi:hypothetical protein